MTTFEFSLLALQHMEAYLAIWIALFCLYRTLFRKVVSSLLDPLYFFVIFTNSICTANVIFLAVFNEIKLYYTLTYLFSEAALIFGILLFARPQPVLPPQHPTQEFITRLKFGMLLTITIAIAANLMVYASNGIPLFLESRNDANAGGVGLFLRLSQVSTGLFVFFYYVKKKCTGNPNSKLERIYFATSIVFGALSGFKAFFLLYVFVYFFANGKTIAMSFKKKALLGIGGTVVMLIMFSLILSTTEIGLVFPALLTRLLASGDVYYMAFVNDTIDQLPTQDFFFQMTGSLLASFRLVGWDAAPLNYGYAINEVVNKNDMLLGPTFRYNVLWLLLTQNPVMTTILSFLVGSVIGLFNRALYRRRQLNLPFILIGFFYIKSFLLILGPDNGVHDSFLSASILIFIVSIVFLPIFRKRTLALVNL